MVVVTKKRPLRSINVFKHSVRSLDCSGSLPNMLKVVFKRDLDGLLINGFVIYHKDASGVLQERYCVPLGSRYYRAL